ARLSVQPAEHDRLCASRPAGDDGLRPGAAVRQAGLPLPQPAAAAGPAGPGPLAAPLDAAPARADRPARLVHRRLAALRRPVQQLRRGLLLGPLVRPLPGPRLLAAGRVPRAAAGAAVG